MTDPYDNLPQTSEMVSALAREINNIREKMFRQQDEIARLTAERDEARRDAERWEDDALRLLNERNAAQRERDDARRMYCKEVEDLFETTGNDGEPGFKPVTALNVARVHGWDCFKEDGK